MSAVVAVARDAAEHSSTSSGTSDRAGPGLHPHRASMTDPIVSNMRAAPDTATTAVAPIRVAIERVDGGNSDQYALELSREVLDVIARRVLELQSQVDFGGHSNEPELLTVSELAARLRVNPNWVYAHQVRLGAIRLGEGPKARLRFPTSAVAAEMQRHARSRAIASGRSEEELRPKRRRRRRLTSRPVPAIEPGPSEA